MGKQGSTRERQILDQWLAKLQPGAVVKELIWSSQRASSMPVTGNIYYQVVKSKPLTVKVLYAEEHLSMINTLISEVGRVVQLDNESIVDLRPVEADEYRETLMAMFM